MDKRQRTTWTFQPGEDVESLVKKEITRLYGRRARPSMLRGARSKILNDAVRSSLAHLKGKREQP